MVATCSPPATAAASSGSISSISCVNISDAAVAVRVKSTNDLFLAIFRTVLAISEGDVLTCFVLYPPAPDFFHTSLRILSDFSLNSSSQTALRHLYLFSLEEHSPISVPINAPLPIEVPLTAN